MRLCKFFFVGCLSLVSLASHAETLNGLYQVLEPVSSQSPKSATRPPSVPCKPW